MALQSILLLPSLALAPAALAYEPDVTQERDETDTSLQAVDHLIPSGRGFPENRPPIYYIARFGQYPSFSDSFEWCVFRKKNRYVLSSWPNKTMEPTGETLALCVIACCNFHVARLGGRVGRTATGPASAIPCEQVLYL